MASLKDLKTRIDSVKSTQKITKAMKMVAASKLRRAQEAAEATRPYADRMASVLTGLGASVAQSPGASPLLVGSGLDKTHLIVVATSERGLCGGFNTNIVRAARGKIEELLRDGKQVKILCIGRKGYSQLRRIYANLILDVIDMSGVKTLGYTDASAISDRLIEMFEAGEFDVCTLFYAHFQSALVQVVTPHQLIPVALPEGDESDLEQNLGGAVYEYEPGETEILNALLPRNIGVQIFRALLENQASEQGARMTAMDNATRNAGDMIERLTLQYNRTRQAAITTELTEIISGAEAL